MMRRGPTPSRTQYTDPQYRSVIVCLLALLSTGCRTEPLTIGGDANKAPDLSVIVVPSDLGGGMDSKVADLLPSIDMSLLMGDMAIPPDLRNVDLESPCGNSCRIGCCGALGQCFGLGDSCGGAAICATTGCVPCGNSGQRCCAGNTCALGGCCNGGICVAALMMCDNLNVCVQGQCIVCGG